MQRVRVLLLPLVFTLGLAALALLPAIRQNPKIFWTFVGVSLLLLVWNLVLGWMAAKSNRTLTKQTVLLRQHYLQACIQGSLFLYWGWYWPQVYVVAHLILAQLLFAYAFDMLL